MVEFSAQLAAHLAQQHVDLTYWINNAKANAAGKVPVSLRITVHGTRAEASPGIRCLPEQWNKATHRLIPYKADKKTGRVELCPGFRGDVATNALNSVLENFEASARLLGNTLQPLAPAVAITASQVRAALLPPKPAPALCALRLLQATVTGRTNPYSQASDQTAYNAFARWLGKDALPLPHLTKELVSAFAAAVPRSARSVARLSALFSTARPKDPNPFTVDAPADPKATRRPRYVLSREEIARLAALDLSGRALWARDVYLCQYYLHGSRVGPVLELDWSQIARGRVRYWAEKGGGEHDVALRPVLLRLLERYGPKARGLVFPLLPADYAALPVKERFKARKAATTLVWHGLQDCAKLLDLPGKLHSHTARHSLATHTVEATGSIRAAQGMLGHKSEATTERYVRSMLASQLDTVADSVYGDD